MRQTTSLLVALLYLLAFPPAGLCAMSAERVEIERSESPSKSRNKHNHGSPAQSKKDESFTFSTKGSNLKFDFNGGFNGEGFHFQMNPGPKALLRELWFSPLRMFTRGWLLAVWLGVSLGIAAFFQPHLQRAREELWRAPGKSIVLGVVWNVAFWVLLAACALLCLVLIGVPLVITLVLFHLVLGVFGMTLTFSVVGEWLARRINRSAVSIYAAIVVGACFLGFLKMLPFFGSVIWFVAGLFGTGAALAALVSAIKAPASTPALSA